MKYGDFNDSELLYYIYEKSDEAIEIMHDKYYPLIKSTALRLINLCRNKGVELSDLIQEGRIGLNNAIEDYKDHKDASFFTFARMCIERRMLSYIRQNNANKHSLLNDSISFEIDDEDDKTMIIEPLLEDQSYNPEEQLIQKERELLFMGKIKNNLTDLENKVFELRIDGYSYERISNELNVEKKAIDNALQRIKIKIKKILDEI